MVVKKGLAAACMAAWLLPAQSRAGTLTKLADLPAPIDAVTPTPGLVQIGTTLYGAAADGTQHGRGAIFAICLPAVKRCCTPLPAARRARGRKLHCRPPTGCFTAPPRKAARWETAPCSPMIRPTAVSPHCLPSQRRGARYLPRRFGRIAALYGTMAGGGDYGNGLAFAYMAGKATILHVFHGRDGAYRESGLIEIGGRLFGATSYGGADYNGTLYAMDPAGQHFATLHVFTGDRDGAQPQATLTAYRGMLYGTATRGGQTHSGTVFRIDPAGSDLSVLYNFNGGDDGCSPNAVSSGPGGLLYGTTELCGGHSAGTVFSLDPASFIEKTLFAFDGGPHGGYTRTSLLRVGDTLLGTTPTGGASRQGPDQGNVFSVAPASGRFSVLHDFVGGVQGGRNSALIAVGKQLFGTSENGAPGNGAIFRTDPATGTTGTLYRFAGGHDGALPSGALTYAAGMLYGATYAGGDTYGLGTLYRLDPATGIETRLYAFHLGIDGIGPLSPLTLLHGALYGAAAGGGFFCGSIFRYDLASQQFELLDTPLHNDPCGEVAGFVAARGVLYATSPSERGEVFTYDPLTNSTNILWGFYDLHRGIDPLDTPLVLNRHLYLTTYYGGEGSRRSYGWGAVVISI